MLNTERKPRVLLTNDDGPPGKDSPYVFGFADHLRRNLGWDVKVVLPSSQKSWIGKAYHINETIKGRYYYPRNPDGLGEKSIASRPVKVDEGEVAEWILIDGTPATCANVALHNLYTEKIDLVISGPNLGRNSSAAFALSSGTIGAALASSLSRCRSIAVSYGTVQRPVPSELFEPAHILACKIIERLWQSWGTVDGDVPSTSSEVDLYNVNIPMDNNLLMNEGMRVVWTRIWRNAYGRLFQEHEEEVQLGSTSSPPPGGPDAAVENTLPSRRSASEQDLNGGTGDTTGAGDHAPELVFKFAPDMRGLIGPSSTPPPGTDAWAVENGMASVTPLCASFAEPYTRTTTQDAKLFEI